MTTQLKISDVEQGLANYQNQLNKLIEPSDLVREIGFAVQMVNSNKLLSECSRESILKSIYNLALSGLSLNPIHKLCALVPKRINGNYEAVLFPQYQGLVKLLTDTGSVSYIEARCVYEGDEFEYSLGLNQNIIHKPKHLTKKISFAYAIGKLTSGQTVIEVMDKNDLDDIKSRSETFIAYKNGKLEEKFVFWIAWEGEMSRKTVLKRLVKYLPKTNKFNQINEAIEIDNSDYKISDSQYDYLINLIENSNYDDEIKHILERKVFSGVNFAEYEQMVNDLKDKQINPVFERGSYNQTQLNKELKKISGDNRRNQ